MRKPPIPVGRVSELIAAFDRFGPEYCAGVMHAAQLCLRGVDPDEVYAGGEGITDQNRFIAFVRDQVKVFRDLPPKRLQAILTVGEGWMKARGMRVEFFEHDLGDDEGKVH